MASCLARQSTDADATLMARALAEGAREAGARFGFVACTVGVDVETLRRQLVAALPGVPFVGVTSCRSVIGNSKLLRGPLAASVLWLCGADVTASVVGQAIATADVEAGQSLRSE